MQDIKIGTLAYMGFGQYTFGECPHNNTLLVYTRIRAYVDRILKLSLQYCQIYVLFLKN